MKSDRDFVLGLFTLRVVVAAMMAIKGRRSCMFEWANDEDEENDGGAVMCLLSFSAASFDWVMVESFLLSIDGT